MPFFTVSNNLQNYLIFTLKIMFRFSCKSYFFSIGGTNNILRDNCFVQTFSSLLSVMENLISFQLYLSIKGSIYDIFWLFFSMFWWFNATVKASWKQLSSLLFRFIVAFLFFNHSGESIYDLLLFKPTFWRW